MPSFQHFKGKAVARNEETITDFDLIKLKARGLMSMAKFKGTSTNILGYDVQSPICVGPFPALCDVKLALNNGHKVKSGAAIKDVCDELGLLCCVPIEQVREVVRDSASKTPFLLYVVPD
jgi:isopentenyl diphosphate isomerase/L-lactate dehydrogenase-like FMN-dependent dehydrogenase